MSILIPALALNLHRISPSDLKTIVWQLAKVHYSTLSKYDRSCYDSCVRAFVGNVPFIVTKNFIFKFFKFLSVLDNECEEVDDELQMQRDTC